MRGATDGRGGRSDGEYLASVLRMCYSFPKALLEYEATCCAQQDAMSAEKQFYFPSLRRRKQQQHDLSMTFCVSRAGATLSYDPKCHNSLNSQFTKRQSLSKKRYRLAQPLARILNLTTGQRKGRSAVLCCAVRACLCLCAVIRCCLLSIKGQGDEIWGLLLLECVKLFTADSNRTPAGDHSNDVCLLGNCASVLQECITMMT